MISKYLDTTLVDFSETENWKVKDAVRGIQIFGSIGSGKTSGSGEFFAKKYLKAKWGGLVLCAKPGEAEEWERYIRQCNRPESDIIHFCEGSEYQFNPLKYESERKTKGGGLTFNLTELFMAIFRMGQRITGSNSEDKERFWENSLKRMINRVIDLLKLSGEEMSVENMFRIISSSPTNFTVVAEIKAQRKDQSKYDELKKTSLFFKCIEGAYNNAISEKEKRDYNSVFNYFYNDFPSLDSKPQSTIKEMFLGFAEPFLSGILNDHFASSINVTPEDSFNGKIIIMDFSVMEYLVSGIYAQCLFKHLWQQAIQRRPIDENTKPAFLWIDESQFFINENDTMFQTTARSSMACCVLLTQNISNYYMQMGGQNVQAKVDSLLGNFGTLIFHANSDAVTNEWASRLIGNEKEDFKQISVAKTNSTIEPQGTETMSQQYQPQIKPVEFTKLKTGGKENNYEVVGYMFVTGKIWKKNSNYIKVSFPQTIIQ